VKAKMQAPHILGVENPGLSFISWYMVGEELKHIMLLHNFINPFKFIELA